MKWYVGQRVEWRVSREIPLKGVIIDVYQEWLHIKWDDKGAIGGFHKDDFRLMPTPIALLLEVLDNDVQD